jgi:hypothetical protein
MPQVQQCEPGQRQIEASQPGHCLEALPHLAGHHQLPRLIGKARKVIRIAPRGELHLLIYVQARQKMRLRGKAGQLEARFSRGLGHPGKIHPGSDVLQTDIGERIVAVPSCRSGK